MSRFKATERAFRAKPIATVCFKIASHSMSRRKAHILHSVKSTTICCQAFGVVVFNVVAIQKECVCFAPQCFKGKRSIDFTGVAQSMLGEQPPTKTKG